MHLFTDMPTNTVNLDALIKREDFLHEDKGEPPSSLGNKMKVSELEQDSFTLHSLRKPDFQRQTSSWTPQKVAGLIKSFAEGDLVPSLILWRSPISNNIFVIDGAHRLSALIAWVHDDYGDKEISMPFFNQNIPNEQLKIAKTTRNLVKKMVGDYKQIKRAVQNPSAFTEQEVKLGRNLGQVAFDLQWLVVDAEKAEQSFKKINRLATPIDPTEMSMIESRRKPNAISARAIMHAGSGHKYWSKFPGETQKKIEEISPLIYDLLFVPQREEVIRSLDDIPIAGRGYAPISLPLLFEFVNLTNNLRHTNAQRKLAEDASGEETLKFLSRVKGVASRIIGLESHSLGLHPIVYSYSESGRFQPSPFLALAGFIQMLKQKDDFFLFTANRDRFEEFLLSHRHFIKQIVSKYGSGLKSDEKVLKYYQFVLYALADKKTDKQIVELLQQSNNLPYLIDVDTPDEETTRKDFPADARSAAVIREGVPLALRCKICNARVPAKSISFDHIKRKEDGGIGVADNAQIAHPYCNSGYKEKLEHSARTQKI